MTDHGPRRVATPANGARGLVNTITPPPHPPGRRTALSRSPRNAPRTPRSVLVSGPPWQAASPRLPGSSGEQPGEAAPKTDRPRQQPTITGPHFERAFAAGDESWTRYSRVTIVFLELTSSIFRVD